MRMHSVKFFYCITIIYGVFIKSIFGQTPNVDSTKLIAGVLKTAVEYKSTVVVASNVIFPESLASHREQATGYIEKFSNKKRDFLLHTYKTGKKYFPKIVAVLERYQLPEELKVLIALESGFKANAVSKAGAVGYWQIMDKVAKEYGLQIIPAVNIETIKSEAKDDRKNFAKSTLAAAKYLRDRKRDLNNDVLLMVASYNCGIGNVRSAIKKCGKPNPDFWDIKNFLPAETRNYVMNFIALNVIFKNYEKFANRQLLFAPKIIDIPVDASEKITIPFNDIRVD
ncbi:MAG: lytic transglycosylase domain-containing protein [Ginsengibacter sp.]